jgi:hypothetical protein
VIKQSNPRMGILQSYSYPVIPLLPCLMFYATLITPIPLYPVPYPAPLPRYPVIPEDSLCESL